MPDVVWQGEGSAIPLRDVCRFADLQQLHEITQVFGGEFNWVLGAVDEADFGFTQFTALALCEVDPHAR